jgi:ethanolamine utilization protein EutN
MMLGQVIGQLVATRKHAMLEGQRLLCVRPYGLHEPSHAVDLIIAVDVLGAGVGEDVVVCFGEPARRLTRQAARPELQLDLPIEAAVAAIVDRTDLDGGVMAALPRPLQFGRGAGGAEIARPASAGPTGQGG